MHLVVQIPCLNEQATLPTVLNELQRQTLAFQRVDIVVIDDGSSDRTVDVARACGAEVVELGRHLGLGRAFREGLRRSLALGADVVVNTDGDNQYPADALGPLTDPIRRGEADLVVGERTLGFRSPVQRALSIVGEPAIRLACRGTGVRDVSSGFRAWSRDYAGELVLASDYTYTIESLIDAHHSGRRVRTVGIRPNPPTRPSRLIASHREYAFQAARQTLTATLERRGRRRVSASRRRLVTPSSAVGDFS